ncbi:HCL640Wp [Eremothecium sinecaudum]|uniref:HCL640Wp n=1 Tax=Eremothecium sinecaudum TaxID=45286 RepID=A0A109UXS9_9SACH|nr:HCL640Wp [Eremothecium sinecaudum]AMD19511.1 HCL640Wp [Eremothecium sinecaudum]
MNVNNLIQEAQGLFQNGNHGEAVNKLTDAARSNPDQSQMSSIENIIQSLGKYVVSNGSGGSGGLGNTLMSTFMSNSGSPQGQLGKLALLSTILGSGKGSGGFNLGSVASMLGGGGGSGGIGSSGLSSIASNFFGGQNKQQGGPQGNEGNSGSGGIADMMGNFLNSQK